MSGEEQRESKEELNGPSPAPAAWQPFTFGGVAAFANASLVRLLSFQLILAAMAGAGVVWFLARDYSPVILQAIQKMPPGACVKQGRLAGVQDNLLIENKYLAIAVTPVETGDIGQSADVQIELRNHAVRVSSLVSSAWGCLEFDYGNGGMNLSRSQLESWWGAWRPVLLTASGLACAVVLILTWASLAVFFSLPVKLIAWFADRKLSWRGAWFLSSAALMPGAVLMNVAILFYGWRLFDLLGLGFWLGAHWIVGITYLIASPYRAPRLPSESVKKNPFTNA